MDFYTHRAARKRYERVDNVATPVSRVCAEFGSSLFGTIGNAIIWFVLGAWELLKLSWPYIVKGLKSGFKLIRRLFVLLRRIIIWSWKLIIRLIPLWISILSIGFVELLILALTAHTFGAYTTGSLMISTMFVAIIIGLIMVLLVEISKLSRTRKGGKKK